MVFRKMLDASGIAYMADNLMGISILQLAARLIEKDKLTARETVKFITVATYKVTEHRAGHQCRLSAEALNEARHILFGIEA